MPRRYKPRAGSMAFYPRVKAKSIIPKFNSFGDIVNNSDCKPLCFFTIKAGMAQVIGKDAHKKSSTYGQEVVTSVTLLDAPDLKVVGARFYKDNKIIFGKKAVFEFLNFDNLISRKIKGKNSKKTISLDDILKRKDEANSLVLLAYLDSKKTSTGQKKPILAEIPLSGDYDSQINYLKEKLNKTISALEVFNADTYLDVKSISKGHGTTGPVKRFNIKTLRPKHQQIERHVGSIGPWHPATIMYTVPRAGQHGFHNRTAYNKKLLMIDSDVNKVNFKAGLQNYGVLKNNYLVVAGSVPGPVKRVVVLRNATRPQRNLVELTDIKIIVN
ncbi:MAG: 50S ribosomal protein L3 [Candidatus ainarchaeum sp.]|nr:50S ribosomal protein L3 [Candidatus ainarchaeum sp.]